MTKTVEVGRAVLASSKQTLELWLTTLIDISPSQQATNIEKLSSLCLLQCLSSGNVWVSRGNGMRIELVLSVRGAPFPKRQLQELRNKITQAPIWSQLSLKPSIPADDVLQDGLAHIAISHSEQDAVEDRRCHRIFDKVPAADIKPPESMSSIQLQVVRFNMDVLESRVRLRVKKSNAFTDGKHFERENSYDEEESPEDIDAQLHETIASPDNDLLSASLTTRPMSRKRKRPGTRAPPRAMSSPVSPLAREAISRRCTAIRESGRVLDQGVLTEVQLDEIMMMVDGAMRHSILGVSKSTTGIKVKANTFVVGLADVAPALWRPGYLFTLSQRAHLIPTITRSFGHLAGMKVTTISLADKLKRLRRPALGAGSGSDCGQSTTVVTRSDGLSSSFADHIWSHLQRSLLTRSTPSPQAFVSSKHVDHPDWDVILDDADQQQEPSTTHSCTTQEGPTMNTVDTILPTLPTSHEIVEQDIVGNVPAGAFPASEDDLLPGTMSPYITVSHEDAGPDSLYTNVGEYESPQESISSGCLIMSGSTSSLGTSEDIATFVFGYGEESLTTPTKGDQWVEEDLLFEHHAGTIAAAEDFSMLPPS